MYIKSLKLTSDSDETIFIRDLVRTCYNGVYPFKIFPEKGLNKIDFAPITIFYGGNGSGKTTLLNILAELTGVTRHSAFSGSAFFKEYTRRCQLEGKPVPECSQILTSDDVTDYLPNIRYLNDGIDVRRNELFDEYLDRKYSSHQLKSMADYDDWKENMDAKKQHNQCMLKTVLCETLICNQTAKPLCDIIPRESTEMLCIL